MCQGRPYNSLKFNCHPSASLRLYNLTIIELTVWPCVWQPTPRTADVTVTKIVGYVRVRISHESVFFCIFGIHSLDAMATLLNMSLSPAMKYAPSANVT